MSSREKRPNHVNEGVQTPNPKRQLRTQNNPYRNSLKTLETLNLVNPKSSGLVSLLLALASETCPDGSSGLGFVGTIWGFPS